MEATKERIRQVYGRVDDAIYDRIKRLADEGRRSIAAQVSILVERGLEAEERAS